MSPVSIPDPVRGTRDLPPEQLRRQQEIAGRLGAVLDQAGYDQIDLPLLEHRDLYLKKSGDELLGKLYHWTQGGRELALRPEWTASVLRMVNSQGDPPLPLRLRYAGPVFRYERPRRATYRQFTQVGVELIGAAGPRADAEIMGLAVQGLRAVGIGDWTLTIGQIGVIKRLLRALGLAERTTSALTWSLERIRSHGLAAVRDQFGADLEELPIDLAALAHLDDADIETLLLRVLPGLGVRLDGGGRDPAAIVNRLVRKLRRSESPGQLERAWQVLETLSAASGPPDAVLPVMRGLLREHGLAEDPLDELAATLAMLRAFEVDLDRVRLDFGMGRGLHYYTGAIFEIDGADGLQLCGGGRYDDLVAALGGRPTPAVGCAYGLERVAAAAPEPALEPQPNILVVCESDAEYPQAIQAALHLRARGYRAALDVRGRSLGANLQSARRRGFGGMAWVRDGAVVLRDLDSEREETLALLEASGRDA